MLKPLITAIRAIQLHCAVMLEVVRFVWGGKDIRVTRTLETGIGDNCILTIAYKKSQTKKNDSSSNDFQEYLDWYDLTLSQRSERDRNRKTHDPHKPVRNRQRHNLLKIGISWTFKTSTYHHHHPQHTRTIFPNYLIQQFSRIKER